LVSCTWNKCSFQLRSTKVNNNNGLLLPLLMFHSKCDKDKGNFLLSVLWPGKCFAPAQRFFSAHISHKSKWRPYQFKLIRRCLLPLWHALETSPTEGGGFMGVRERESEVYRVRGWEGTIRYTFQRQVVFCLISIVCSVEINIILSG